MAFIFSISGSTVASESERLRELFKWYPQAIEIGDIKVPGDFEAVVQNCKRQGIRLGVHSPLYSIDDRYGLLRGEPAAWDELQRNLERARAEGFAYVTVHFPYVWDQSGKNLGVHQVREFVPRIKRLERAYGVPVVCEPKLGPRRDPAAFVMLWTLSKQELLQWDLSLCLDVGDLYLAAKSLRSSYEDMVAHLAPWCHVVHLHHVWTGGTRYYWTPVEEHGNVPILETLEILGGIGSDIFAVIQHTPHRVRDNDQVAKGINWLLSNTGPWKYREGISTYDGKYRCVK
jgi:sugar phosphate isomerase/epimerase